MLVTPRFASSPIKFKIIEEPGEQLGISSAIVDKILSGSLYQPNVAPGEPMVFFISMDSWNRNREMFLRMVEEAERTVRCVEYAPKINRSQG